MVKTSVHGIFCICFLQKQMVCYRGGNHTRLNKNCVRCCVHDFNIPDHAFFMIILAQTFLLARQQQHERTHSRPYCKAYVGDLKNRSSFLLLSNF